MVQDIFELFKNTVKCDEELIENARRKCMMDGIAESQALFESNCGTKSQILKVMSQYYNMLSLTDTSEIVINQSDVSLIGEENILKFHFLPYRKIGNVMNFLIVDPRNSLKIEDIVNPKYGNNNRFIIIMESDFSAFLLTLNIDNVNTQLNNMVSDLIVESEEDAELEEDEDYDQVSVVNFVNKFILDAYQKEASDIHIEPLEKNVRVRFRIDGLLSTQAEFEKGIHKQLVNRIKVMSNLDSTLTKVPQSGKLHLTYKGVVVDARVSTIPTLYGEVVTLRLITNNAKIKTLEELGFSENLASQLRRIMQYSHGLILVTGPTGSGKSSTLASVLSELNTIDKCIITIEDPVEYKIAGVNQVNINNNVNLTFASVLRETLRQDPDIIMVGEIRDSETAQISMSASSTGHLVLSTLHTNSAATSAIRLKDMGIEPFMVASTVRGIVNQKLVRKLCPYCKKKRIIKRGDAEYNLFNTDEEEIEIYRSSGCTYCNNTGYKGRTIILELLEVTPEISSILLNSKSIYELEAKAVEQGMVRARDSAMLLVEQGVTSIEEVNRVLNTGI